MKQRLFVLVGLLAIGLSSGALPIRAHGRQVLPSALPLTRSSSAMSGTLAITIERPQAGDVVQDTLQVVVNISSTYEIQSVSARGADRTVSLIYTVGRWRRNISMAGIARGTYELVVTATDALGNTAEAYQSFIVDRGPVLDVAHPYPKTVAHPQIRIIASCTDDDPVGCRSLTARVGDCITGPVLARGIRTLNALVSLAAYPGGRTVCIVGEDSRGQKRSVQRTVLVESSRNIRYVESVLGTILDAHPDRILYVDTSNPDEDLLKTRDRATKAEVILQRAAKNKFVDGFLSPHGAIFVQTVSRVVLFEARDGQVIELDANYGASTLKVSGHYAVWKTFRREVKRRDLESGTTVTVSQDSVYEPEADVASNGDVVYNGHGGSIIRYRNGETQQLTFSNGLNRTPVTDGNLIVFGRSSDWSNPRELIVYEAGREIVLDTQEDGIGRYLVNNGWIAYVKPGPTGVLQVWLRSAAGTEHQITPFSTNSTLDALGPTGEVTFINGNRRYLAKAGETPLDIGGDFGGSSRSFYEGDQWHVIIGRSLFQVRLTQDVLSTYLPLVLR